jgi:hypothetical protein
MFMPCPSHSPPFDQPNNFFVEEKAAKNRMTLFNVQSYLFVSLQIST